MPSPEIATDVAQEILSAPITQVIGLVLVIIAIAVPLLILLVIRQQNVQRDGNKVLLKVVEDKASDRVGHAEDKTRMERMIASMEQTVVNTHALTEAQIQTYEETKSRRAQIDSMGAHLDKRLDGLLASIDKHGEESVVVTRQVAQALIESIDHLSRQIATNIQGSLERHGELMVQLQEMRTRVYDVLAQPSPEETPHEP